jgi:hypothetical protein
MCSFSPDLLILAKLIDVLVVLFAYWDYAITARAFIILLSQWPSTRDVMDSLRRIFICVK